MRPTAHSQSTQRCWVSKTQSSDRINTKGAAHELNIMRYALFFMLILPLWQVSYIILQTGSSQAVFLHILLQQLKRVRSIAKRYIIILADKTPCHIHERIIVSYTVVP